MIKYIILTNGPFVKVYRLTSPLSREEIINLKFFSEINFTNMSFPDKDNNLIKEQEVAHFEGIPPMRFIAWSGKSNRGENYWEYNMRSNSPILELSIIDLRVNKSIEIGANRLLKFLLRSYLNGDIDEMEIITYINLIEYGNNFSEDFIIELVILIISSYIPSLDTFGTRYSMMISSINLPPEFDINNYGGKYSKYRYLGYQYVQYKDTDLKKILLTLKELTDAILIRSIPNLRNLHEIDKLIFQDIKSFSWFSIHEIVKLTALLSDQTMSIFEVSKRIKFSSKYNRCFISYSTHDQQFADKIYIDLVSKGVECWYSPKDIKAGQKIHQQISEAIKSHDKILLILSTESMKSEWVKTEIAHARQREIVENKSLLIPISLVPFDSIKRWSNFDADIGKDSAKEIREYFILDFLNWENSLKYFQSFSRLLLSLENVYQ